MSDLDRTAIVEQLESVGVVAVIRASSAEQLVNVCQALRDGGATACEITMTTPGALDAIAAAADKLGDSCLIGVGSVLDAATAEAAIAAGARFVFAPTLDVEVIATAHRHGCACVPGALSPTEILTAWNAGADMVKIFPANHFGPQYIKDIHAPMPHLKVTPTGGVNLDTAAAWIKAGAAALGVGSALVKKDMIKAKDWKGLAALARQYVDIVATARGG